MNRAESQVSSEKFYKLKFLLPQLKRQKNLNKSNQAFLEALLGLETRMSKENEMIFLCSFFYDYYLQFLFSFLISVL